jgi:hypothetical protein
MNAVNAVAVHLGEDDEHVGEAAVGDPHLLAVQHQLPSAWLVARVLAASASDPDPDSLSA